MGERYGQVTLTLLPGAGYQLPVDTFETVNIHDDDAPPPPAQPRVGPGIGSGSRLTLRWQGDPGATGYQVRWGEAAQSERRTARANAPEYTTPDLSPGVQYAFEVASCNASGCGEASPEVVGSVGPAGTPPTANAGPDLEALPGTTVTLQGRDSTNPHGAWYELAHSWAQREGPEVQLSDPTKGTPSFAVPAATPVGTAFRFALTVTDRDGETDTDETTVRVVAVLGATPPTANAGPDLEAEPGETATLGAETEAVEGWTYAWTQTSGPSVALTGADAPRASFAVPSDAADGTAFGFSLRVTDAQGGEATDATAVTVARTASACATGLGSLGVGGSAERGAEHWDNAGCRAHHRAERPARYFRFTLAERARVSIDLTTDADAALFVSKGTPKNGWGTPARAGMAHRLKVRRDNGKLLHGASLSASLVLAPGEYTAEAVLDADGSDSWRVPSFGLNVEATAATATASVSVADARVEEGPGAVLSFAVTRDGPTSGTARVSWATSDGTAVAGADYTAGSGTLTFAPGDTEKTITVTVLDDAHDEGEETLTLTLSNPDGVGLGDAEATGTIANTDSLQREWLARFGRTVAGQMIEALEGRFAMGPGTPSHATIAGRRLDFSGAPPPRYERWTQSEGETHGMDLREVLLGSSFHFTAGEVSGLGAMTTWGKALAGSSHSAPGGGLSFTSETMTGVLGMDWERDNLLVGMALSESVESGAAGFGPSGADYDLEGSLSLVTPYARLRARERLSLWTMMGSGEGRLSLAHRGARQSADIGMQLVAAGGRADLLRPEGGGFALALKTDAYFVRTESDSVSTPGVGNLAGATGTASRVRAMLEGSRSFALSGGTVEPSLSLGLRHDGGDAESGAGVELGAGLAWSDPSHGLTSDLRFHGLAAHEDGGYDEWGVSGSLRIVPGPSGGGLSLSMTPSWGAGGQGGRLWETRPSALAGDGGAPPAARLDTELGYGLAAFGGAFTGTPYAGLGVSDGDRRYRASSEGLYPELR